MTDAQSYSLDDFLPYLFSQAADALSLEFQQTYRTKYNMLRTEWRVLFHLGCFGDLTAKEICDRSNVHKTKVSRAVASLEKRGFLTRETMATDRRHSVMCLTAEGREVFKDLQSEAQTYNAALKQTMTPEEFETLHSLLLRIAQRQ